MTEKTFQLVIKISDFDLSLLPISPELLKGNPDLLGAAVERFYIDQFAQLPGQATILRSNDSINILWNLKQGLEGLIEIGVDLLKTGDTRTGISMLQSAIKQQPENETALFNLGMALSDAGKIQEAVELLNKLVEVAPGFSSGWVALGVALVRKGDREGAKNAFKTATQINPDDPYALKNLGSLLANDDPKEGIQFLKRAVDLLPNDQGSLFGYGAALYQTKDSNAADEVLKRAVDVNPLTELAEMARGLRTKIAAENMRSVPGGGIRFDSVMYCLGAIKKFEANPEKLVAIATEIAMLGRSGLDINNPAKKYTLRSMEGEFSGLQLVSYMYVGFQMINPELDCGIDLSREYQEALRLANQR